MTDPIRDDRMWRDDLSFDSEPTREQWKRRALSAEVLADELERMLQRATDMAECERDIAWFWFWFLEQANAEVQKLRTELDFFLTDG